MPAIATATDPHSISQGSVQSVSDLVFGTPTGDAVTITSAGSNIPLMIDKEFFEIRGNSNAVNNGLYQVDDATPAANSLDVRKVSGSDPVVEAVSEDNDILCTLITASTDADWNNASADTVDIISVLGLPADITIGSRFEVQLHATAANNGVYEALTAVTDGFNCLKLTGSAPADAAAEALDFLTERKTIHYDASALGLYLLEQPGLDQTAVADAVWGTPVAAVVGVTSAGANLPTVTIGQKVLVTAHSSAANNGNYVVRAVTTINADWTLEMVDSGVTPVTAISEAVDFDLNPLGIDFTGVNGQPIYSRIMIDWKDDPFLVGNAPFPMLTIDADAGKYLIGQDASGNNSGWNFADNAEFGIRSRKLARNMGWQEIDATGLVTAEYAGLRTLGAFEDNFRDLAYLQFGTDTTVDDTIDFEFAGPADEAVKVLDATVSRLDAGTGYAITTNDTITRNDGGNWSTDGYKVGGRVIIDSAEDPANDGSHTITSVGTGVDGAIVVTSALTNNAADNTANFTLDNRFAVTLRLRPRDDDTNGKTFGQARLADAGVSNLSNRVFAFPLATAADLKISATDATITGSSPWNGMTITFHSTGQARAGLVGGSFNFGIIIAGNNGTSQEVYEFVQWSLRQLTDIDADADTAIGRTIDGLMRFVGDSLEVGSTDGGLTFPTNPDGGGSGVFIDALNAVSANDVLFYDNLGLPRTNPETIAVTLDANQTLIDDIVAEMDLFFDRTIRTSVSDFILTLVTGDTGTFNSAGANLPALDEGAGAYVRISGLAGGDAAMNGVYQVTAETSTSIWNVTRYDGTTIVSTSSAVIPIDEHPINTPSNLTVDTNNLIAASTISFTAPDTIGDTGSGFGIFAVGDTIRITGGTNDGIVAKIATAAAGTLTIEQGQFDPTLLTEAAGSSRTLTQTATIEAIADFVFAFDFDGNVQGGRAVSTPTAVQGKAIGQTTAQYTESAVLSIVSGTPLIVPLSSQQERNVQL